MKTIAGIVATKNPLGVAAGAILLAYRCEALDKKVITVEEVTDDPNHGDHFVIGIDELDHEVPGAWKRSNRSVIILPIPSVASREMFKQTVLFSNFNMVEETNHYHLMNIRLLVTAVIEYLTTGEVLEDPSKA